MSELFAAPRGIALFRPRASFDCSTAAILAYYRAMQLSLGDEAFDVRFPRLRVGPWICDEQLARQLTVMSPVESGEDAPEPGDCLYFQNPDVGFAGLLLGYRGFNAIYLGRGQYYAHPLGLTSAEEIIRRLRRWSPRGAQVVIGRKRVRLAAEPDAP